ncbi:MAG: hypothetical protein B6D39_07415 [Anaerolineae bacterium UTCFX2]|jgi:phosphatidylserine/phosphatidylglycerophosphate/cardiolipin synthase-like enzyme|nr:DUF1669 domain-containing protein [Anaerolineae bacterium]MCZ7552012.1 phospholipase D-like domain-containing protein [Anaerolineales bacterium]OQY90977.1 MAG: hypothetical protein B6D39_07415 [Anaerolineae bacterium UTCFX2]
MTRSSNRRFSYPSFVIAALLLASLACQVSAPQNPGLRTEPVETHPPAASWFSIYFTDPSAPDSQSLRNGPDRHLASAIEQAHFSVDVAVLQLNLWSVRDALISAHQRGVRVRMVTDSDYLDTKEIQQLIAAGIPLLGDRREGTMHNKFVVIDQLEVWTGSMNFTLNESYRNNNTLIRLRSPELAQNFTAEFEEMFVDDKFGPGSPANTSHPSLMIGNTKIETCFSPDDGCTAQLLRVIESAQKSLAFLAYSFTSDDLANALIKSAERGVRVEGVMESSQVETNRGSDYARFLAAGLDVRLDANPKQMHEKVMIIDGQIVALGSFNFTFSAETRNDENLLIIHDPQIAALYQAEFERLFNQAPPAR